MDRVEERRRRLREVDHRGADVDRVRHLLELVRGRGERRRVAVEDQEVDARGRDLAAVLRAEPRGTAGHERAGP